MSLLFPAAVGGIAGVTVRKNTMMPVIGNRPQLNLIEGASVGINIADNPPDDEIDITISTKYPTRFKLLIPDAASLPTANPAAKATVDGTNFAYDVLDFDPGTEESANWEAYLTPDYLSENIVADIFWESAGAGDAKFGFSVLGREKGDDWDVALGAEQTVVTTNLGAGKLNKSRITTFAPGWSPGDVILFKLARKAGDVLDTIDGDDVRVLKVVVSYTGQFAQAFYPLAAPVDLTADLPATGSWGDVNVSGYNVPVGATGVILHFVNPENTHRNLGFRKKGSTDNRHADIHKETHGWAVIGIDENRKFQIYRGDTDTEIYLVGYTATGVVLFDNAYKKNVSADDTWENMDLSAECPGAIGIIIETDNVAIGGATARNAGVQKNGSSDDFMESIANEMHSWQIIGCDGSQIIEAYTSDKTNVSFYIIGYVTEGAVFKLNAVDNTPVPCESWTEVDFSGDAPSGVMLFFQVCGMLADDYGVCKNGLSAGAIYDNDGQLYFALVACDSGQKVEMRVHYSDYDRRLKLVGYATWAGA